MCSEQFASVDGQLDLGCGGACAARCGEVNAVIGKYRVHLVRNGFEQGPEKIARYLFSPTAWWLFVQLDECEKCAPIQLRDQTSSLPFSQVVR